MHTVVCDIGRALEKWHTVGWLHQGVSSHNIVFFRGQDVVDVDYANPFLCGFDYSRAADEASTPRHQRGNSDVYRHPDRQGFPPAKSHKKTHDLYAFGLLLLEISQ
ncbi:hypothetical protein B0T24DRAFT_722387 [Lasiosphaeria ovina]|uniref:Protein kinase domain-containing protein n=1 Tax=Lasiosphaeria ovina TaxID=92902 RepID=A0AAE0N455_9PEZI|nr:hypothetical protein B0T24DRAFT_722387 [Lasiosphaeria ovina]